MCLVWNRTLYTNNLEFRNPYCVHDLKCAFQRKLGELNGIFGQIDKGFSKQTNYKF